jgi:hypothetical protein
LLTRLAFRGCDIGPSIGMPLALAIPGLGDLGAPSGKKPRARGLERGKSALGLGGKSALGLGGKK